jgi:hypothetical protein
MDSICTCNECGLQFDNKKILANHVRWKHKDNSSFSQTISIAINKRYDKSKGSIVDKKINCEICKKEFTIKERELKTKSKYYCSRACANSREHSTETKKRQADSLKKKWKEDPIYAENVLRNRENTYIFRSKGELEVLNWLKSNIPADWTSGGCILYKNERLVRDAYSKDLKICVEYDGIWHFKDIHGQLKRKTNKDELLKDWCEENGYMLIRISEDRFKRNKDECFSILKQTIDNKVEGLTLIY